MKTYKQFINESLLDKMVDVSDEEIMAFLSKLNTHNKLIKIKDEGLDDKFMPTDDELKKFLLEIDDLEDRIRTIKIFNLNNKFMPTDNELKKYLSEFDDLEDRIQIINNLNLDDEFMPTDNEIKNFLSELDIEDWLNTVYNLKLDNEFNPPPEKILEYILPSNINYNSKNGILEFSEWSDFADLFVKERDVVDDYIESVLSGMGREYFEYYDVTTPDYFDFSNDKIFQNIKTYIKEKIDELNLSDEDEYDEMINDFNSSKSFSDLYDHVLTKYDILDDIKDVIDRAYTNAQELADESEAYNTLLKKITDKFKGGEISYDNDKELYIMPITIPDFDVDDIVDNGKIIKLKIPYNGWYGEIDDGVFAEEISVLLDDI